MGGVTQHLPDASSTWSTSEGPAFRTVRRTRGRGTAKDLHSHDESQLIYAASGAVQVYTERGCWLVPPQLAVWVPTGIPHRLDMLTDSKLWMIYWHPATVRVWAGFRSLDREFALHVTPLLRELIFAAFETGAAPERSELVVRLILQELTEAPDAPTFLPLPTGTIGRRVVDLVLADPRMRLDLDALASRAATSGRTISRLFPKETGLTFKTWRQRARIVLAIDRMSADRSIASVAASLGFASTAAFSFAFRQVTRMSPADFLDVTRYDPR